MEEERLDILKQIEGLPEKDRLTLVKSISDGGLLNHKQQLYLSSKLSSDAKRQIVEKHKEEGKTLSKRIDAEISTEGMLHMLTNRSSVEEALTHVEQAFRQPVGWAKDAKNKPLTNAERKQHISLLKEKHKSSKIELLQHLLDEGFTSFKEIQEPETYGKQLNHLQTVIRISDRVDALEKEVSELKQFKEQQMMFNRVVVEEISTQRDIVHSMLEMTNPKFTNTPEEISTFRKHLSLLDSEEDKIKYLLNNGVNKKQSSMLLDIPLRTFMRKCKKYGI